MVRRVLLTLLLTGAGLCLGCNRKPGVEGVVAVSGTVTYQGKPVEGANVMFAPQNPEARSASGRTDASGRFQLTTLQSGDGAVCGAYKVAISKVQVENPMTADEARAWFEKNGGPPEPGNVKNELPEDYKDAGKSGLTAEVTDGGANDFTFELK
jgi:hypothetical protein